MIVRDENLLVLRLGNPIAAWYPGRVCSVVDLDPGALIKDETIPTYLRRSKGVTFVTTNVPDFWRRTHADARYCIVCFALPNERLRELSALLRRLLRISELKTKAARMGKVIRVTQRQIHYYTGSDFQIHSLEWRG
ncbi:MAG: hypothetical protein EXR78_06090 [Deltaproteobacteria bacterium]|nr:hypothetical protein [Deltaproteobacteria bacterium]